MKATLRYIYDSRLLIGLEHASVPHDWRVVSNIPPRLVTRHGEPISTGRILRTFCRSQVYEALQNFSEQPLKLMKVASNSIISKLIY
jgi:hypothetical protein